MSEEQQPQIYLRGEGFRDAALTSGGPGALLAASEFLELNSLKIA